jgi:tetratricopeptide (TPR) repeat protein
MMSKKEHNDGFGSYLLDSKKRRACTPSGAYVRTLSQSGSIAMIWNLRMLHCVTTFSCMIVTCSLVLVILSGTTQGPPNGPVDPRYVESTLRKKVAELTKQIEAPPTFNLAWFLDDMGRAHFDRGECYFHLGEYAKAINDFTAASRSRMNNCLEGTGHTSFDGCEGLADVHCAIGQFDKAAEDLEQIIRIEENYEFGEKHEKGPAYAPLYLYRAQCLIETQQYEAALTELNKCETALPYPADPYTAIPKN